MTNKPKPPKTNKRNTDCLVCDRGTIGLNPQVYQRILDWHKAGHPSNSNTNITHIKPKTNKQELEEQSQEFLKEQS